MIYKAVAAILLAAGVVAPAGAGNESAALTLHYDRPAAAWTEALPIGNGRLGAMVFGRPADELLQLNEATLWSGGRSAAPSIPAPMPPWARYARRWPAATTRRPTPWRARCRAAIPKASCR